MCVLCVLIHVYVCSCVCTNIYILIYVYVFSHVCVLIYVCVHGLERGRDLNEGSKQWRMKHV